MFCSQALMETGQSQILQERSMHRRLKGEVPSVGTGIQKVDAEEAEHRKIGKLVLFSQRSFMMQH